MANFGFYEIGFQRKTNVFYSGMTQTFACSYLIKHI